MLPPEDSDRIRDFGYFTHGVLFSLIGARFFFDRATIGYFRLFAAIGIILGVVILATAPRYLWRFPSLCTSMMTSGGFLALYGILVAMMGETGGWNSLPTERINGLYGLVVGAILVTVGSVLKKLYSVLKR
jgi:hypothetical protein